MKPSLPGSTATLGMCLALVGAASAAGACSLPVDGLDLVSVGTPEAGANDDAWQPIEGGGPPREAGATGDGPSRDAASAPDAPPVDAPSVDASTADTSTADTSTGDAASGRPDASSDGDSGSTLAPGGPSLCPNSGLLFCDGFEGTLSAWAVDTAGGEVTLDTTRAFHGTYSLHAHTDAVPAGTMPFQKAYVDRVEPLPRTLFARAFLYIPSPYAGQSAAGVLNAFQDVVPYAGAEIDLLPGTDRLAFNGFNAPSVNGNIASSTTLPLDTWHCLEMEMDGAAQAFHAYLDNVEIMDLAHDLAGAPPPLGVLQVGLGFSQATVQGAADLWVDEVAFDGARIGCH